MRTKLTPKVQELIGNNIKLGMPYKFAAEHAGIDESTFYRWLREGEAAKAGLQRQFCQYIKTCEAEGMKRNLTRIEKASEQNWNAAAWLLSRRYPDQFGRKDRLDSTVKADLKADVSHSGGVRIFLPDDGRNNLGQFKLKPSNLLATESDSDSDIEEDQDKEDL